ncbi:amidohydrolase family protein [Myroides sp. WP-1]|uniref:metal-dependent hydrolase family protein n=1 Tax=Myroides sp. WP-1 TaxID=2759944 RepID=UPI0015F816FA|nr:amidohydrolase family protein [Myroides sp. WP-1]MBB1139957.1 amidohydrolase family protein [Myroides sp. WP-1]
MTQKFLKISLLFSVFCFTTATFAQNKIVLSNVEIFNGKDNKTKVGSIVIEKNKIVKIIAGKASGSDLDQAQVIDGQGKFVMPGMIDSHWHSFLAANSNQAIMLGDESFLFINAAKESENTLQRGFTTVRDLGGHVMGIKQANDYGINKGPRIYPSEAMISQTGGHGDASFPWTEPRMIDHTPPRFQVLGGSIIADGEQEVTVAAREQLRKGASQLKVMAGGGVATIYDPLDATQYTTKEIKAAVDAAENWGTYVTVHAYTPKAVKQAIDAGVKCVDHGHLLDEATVKILGEKDIWLSMQPFDLDASAYTNPEQAANKVLVGQGTENVYTWAKKHKVKLAFGTDLVSPPKNPLRQNELVVNLKQWFTNFEILKMITYDNAQLLKMSGPRNPYPADLGTLAEDAYADILLFDKSPLEDISVIGDPKNNILLIIKDGKIYKDQLTKK